MSCPRLLKLLSSLSDWASSSSATRIFIFVSVKKFVDLPAHLLREDQERTPAALIEHALAVALEQFVERGGSEFPLLFQNVTMRDLSSRTIPA
jgi:hypothetical protein